MFLKWTGGLLILFAGSGMGVWLAWGYKKRLSTLENLRRMIYCLKGEIVYSHAPLEEAFERIGKREKGVLGELFTQTAEKIGCHNGETFSKIWEQTIEEMEKNGKSLFLEKEDREKLLSLGGQLGLSGYPDAGENVTFVFGTAGTFCFKTPRRDPGKMPAQYSLRGDGKPVFSDCNALGVERNYGCKSHFQVAAVGILVSVICQVLKHSGRDEQAFLTSLAGLVMVLFWMIPYIYDLFETMKQLFLL